MLRRLTRHLNPSTAIAFLALILATTGGAFAATGGIGSHPSGSGAQATAAVAHSTAATAKSKAGPRGRTGPRGPVGAKGATGTTGTTGATGPVGSQGATGPAGPKGENGAGVTTAKFTGARGSCPEGGTEFTSASGTAYACRGEEGSPGENGKGVIAKEEIKGEPGVHCTEGGSNFEVEGTHKVTYACNGLGGSGGILSKGSSETGVWTSENENSKTESYEFREVSFSIPLAAALPSGHAVFVTAAEQTEKKGEKYEHCLGGVEEPKALDGYLCIYQGYTENPAAGEFEVGGITPPGVEPGSDHTAGRSGAVFILRYEGGAARHYMQGSWAVTGE